MSHAVHLLPAYPPEVCRIRRTDDVRHHGAVLRKVRAAARIGTLGAQQRAAQPVLVRHVHAVEKTDLAREVVEAEAVRLIGTVQRDAARLHLGDLAAGVKIERRHAPEEDLTGLPVIMAMGGRLGVEHGIRHAHQSVPAYRKMDRARFLPDVAVLLPIHDRKMPVLLVVQVDQILIIQGAHLSYDHTI